MKDYSKLTTLFPHLDIEALTKTIETFGITNDCEFIAQCAHESSNFRRFKENLNYSSVGLMKTFPKYFPDEEFANQFARQPQKIALVIYSNRMGNGDKNSMDAWKYIGRGAIQLTGKNNYKMVAKSLVSHELCEDESDILDNSELLETAPFAYYSAGAFWEHNSLNNVTDFKVLTKKINGGLIGYAERSALLEKVKTILG